MTCELSDLISQLHHWMRGVAGSTVHVLSWKWLLDSFKLQVKAQESLQLQLR